MPSHPPAAAADQINLYCELHAHCTDGHKSCCIDSSLLARGTHLNEVASVEGYSHHGSCPPCLVHQRSRRWVKRGIVLCIWPWSVQVAVGNAARHGDYTSIQCCTRVCVGSPPKNTNTRQTTQLVLCGTLLRGSSCSNIKNPPMPMIAARLTGGAISRMSTGVWVMRRCDRKTGRPSAYTVPGYRESG